VIGLDRLNDAGPDKFAAALDGVFENAPWVAAGAAMSAPFETVTALHTALVRVAREAPAAERLNFLRGHPELADKVARAGAMTADSVAEQGGLGLNRLSEPEFARFETLNAAYREKFGFPFIICVRRHTRDSILTRFARRLENSAETEQHAALDEIGFISRLRLVDRVTGPGMPVTTGMLSTHVLNVARGCPADGVRVVLREIGASGGADIAEARTGADGRTAAPLIAREPLRIGTYELLFHAGAYFAAGPDEQADPPFLDVVPVRFSIADSEGHYHVSLLLSPWSYSTYRGS
jgi:2-oxo-4-hydroxy-4-carboxy-5-ureidoimidazoline decarboxylase